MASLTKLKNASWVVQFTAGDGRRKSVGIGRSDRKTAQATCRNIGQLVGLKRQGATAEGRLADWLCEIGDGLHAKLAALELCQPRSTSTLRAFCTAYIEGRSDAKPRTKINLRNTSDRLTEHFGADRPLRSILPGHADEFAVWLKGKYAPETAARTLRRARQFFQAALRRGLVPNNPFADVKIEGGPDASRQEFIDRDRIGRVLDACPNAEWRLIVALARFGGLRVPSELVGLTFGDLDWEKSRFLVRSPKTEHHRGKGERWVPIFPELRPFLEEVFERAAPGTVYVFPNLRDGATKNLRTQLERIVRRAGLTPWPKLFCNLRASRQTELVREHPVHVVCRWVGNSAAIANRHYLQLTEEDYERATDRAANSAARAAEALQNSHHSLAVQEDHEGSQPHGIEGVSTDGNLSDLSSVGAELPPAGVEPATSALGKLRSIHLSYGGVAASPSILAIRYELGYVARRFSPQKHA